MLGLRLFLGVAVLAAPLLVPAQSNNLFDAVRSNDLRALKSGLQKADDANARDRQKVPLLMYATAFGSPEAVRMLIESGADVNAKNAFDATALMWGAGDPAKARLLIEHGADVNAKSKLGRTPLIVAASHDGGSETVRLLLEKGADAAAKDNFGTTALIAAAFAGDTESVRLLIQKGADVNAADIGGSTALMNAAGDGNVAAVKLLLAKGANVNAANTGGGRVKFGPIQLIGLTPLMWAAPSATPEMIQTLLKAGAQVNAKDSRGMTPLMLAVASEAQNPQVARLLIEAGTDVNVKSTAGETALDWALKFGRAGVIAALKKAGAATAAVYTPPVRKAPGEMPAADRSVEKSLALIERVSAEFFKQSGCVGCHHQPITSFAVAEARRAGFRVDEDAAHARSETMKFGLNTMAEGFLQRVDGPAGADIQTATLLGMAAEKYQPDPVTDAAVVNVAAQQRADGSWCLRGVSRAPMEEGSIARTANAVRVMKAYGPAGRKAEFDRRVARARDWLVESKPRTTDDLAMRLLGLAWSGAGKEKVQAAAKALMARQQPDGGWASNVNLASDAFATGESLYALRAGGSMAVSDAAYRHGVRYLLGTQFEDGSWYVRSRAPKFQPYFQSGFPFDHDQWISATATSWAVAALAPAVKVQTAKN